MATKLLWGDALVELSKLDAGSINLVVTSPPYDKARDYKGHSWDFEGIARQMYRTLMQRGVLVWVVNDTVVKGGETLTSFRQALFFQEIGFRMHDTMIYRKRNFSHPEKTRYHQVFEYMFVLSKGQPAVFNPIKDKVNATAGEGSWGVNRFRERDGSMSMRSRKVSGKYGMRGNVWEGKTRGQEEGAVSLRHPAMMPKWLAHDHILTWSNPGDWVLDPFMGSGTVGLECVKLGRNFAGIEIAQEYYDLAAADINKAQQMSLPDH